MVRIRHEQKPRVLLDVDGVLADFASGFLAIINEMTGRRYVLDEIDQFDVGRALKLEADEYSDAKRELAKTPRFAAKLRPYPGAVDGVAALREISDVRIVTSPWNSHPTWTFDREEWLRKHFKIEHAHVTHTSEKFAVRGDVFVDDKVDHVTKWASANARHGLAVHWKTLHNRNEQTLKRATSSWAQLLDWVRERT